MAILPVTTTIDAADATRSRKIAKGFIASQEAIESRTEREKQEIERLRSAHLDYQDQFAHWTFLLRAYEGGPSYVSEDTLFRHQREHRDDYTDRLGRAFYQNYCQPIVDFVPEYIYKDPIEREASPNLQVQFDKFKNDVDRCGTDMSAFWQLVAEDARLFGKVYVQVDKLPRPAAINRDELSVLEATELGLDIPYFILIRPLEVLDWRTDRFGNYLYLKRVEYTVEEIRGELVDVERYSEWTPSEVRISVVAEAERKKPMVIRREQVENAWGVVPFVAILHKRSKRLTTEGISAIRDIAYQNRHVFNLTSLIDEFLYRQCFNILAMEKDTALPTAEQVEGDLGTSNVLEVARGANFFPAYISPPVDPAKFIQEERSIAIREMYRQAAQDVASELFAVSNRSGDAAKQAFGRTVPSISRLADVMQNAEVKALRLWAKMQGKDWAGKVAYRDDYSITNLQDLLLQLTMIFNSLRVLPPTFIREEWKRIIREFDGRISQDQKEKIFAEIDQLSDEELVELYDQSNDTQSDEEMPSAGNLIQGETQAALGTDRRIAMATGSRAATKEAVPDANRRVSGPTRSREDS